MSDHPTRVAGLLLGDRAPGGWRTALGGAHGPRPIYHQHYYGAFVFDPDVNNIEAVCHLLG